ncbi:MAG TPA: thiamine pyrophosphate-dependent enzyme, partial [Gemmatimonadota bacterium]|nr:thiamine pyrophosphate-dependent enzyme [Gemmatimonadota bacterium]
NNQVALGTQLREHHAAGDFSEWGRLYGAATASFDGNNVLDAYAATRWAAERCRSGDGPVFLAAETFRMGGHATHDEAEARDTFPAELFAEWGRRDPIGCYEEWLAGAPIDLRSGERVAPGEAEGSNREVVAETELRVSEEVESAAEEALASRQNMPRPGSSDGDVYDGWPPSDYPGPAPFSR